MIISTSDVGLASNLIIAAGQNVLLHLGKLMKEKKVVPLSHMELFHDTNYSQECECVNSKPHAHSSSRRSESPHAEQQASPHTESMAEKRARELHVKLSIPWKLL